MQNYDGMTPTERLEFRAMMAGYDLRGNPAVTAGKKAAATRKANKKMAVEANA